ncbi:MAG: PQQ-binding-like beta-propeller repeat protein, partial [Methanomassiliicoccaceae archaeon]|nr:PQQ-binding-like beta-propeller repeat protein [Methanomassiliicoccaceae archaeon]
GVMAAMPVLAALMMAIPAVAAPASGEEGYTGDGEGFVVTSAELFAPIMAEDVLVAVGAAVLKFSATGELLWVRNLEQSGLNFMRSAAVTSDGFVAVGTNIAKYNTSGDRVWEKGLGGSNPATYQSVAATGDGFAAAGSKGDSAVVAKYAGNGALVWEKVFDRPSPNTVATFTHVAAVPDGFVVVGSAYDVIRDGNRTYHGNLIAIMAKYDLDGSLEWEKVFDSNQTRYFRSLAAVPDGFVTAGGANRSAVTMYDNDGAVVWEKKFGGGNDYLNSVAAVPDGIIAVGSAYDPSFGSGDWAGVREKGSWDATVVKFSFTGDALWGRNFGGAGSDSFESVAAAPGGFAASGNMYAKSFGTGDLIGTESKTEVDTVLVKFDDAGDVEWVHNLGGFDIKGLLSDILVKIAMMILVLVALIVAVSLLTWKKRRGAALWGR